MAYLGIHLYQLSNTINYMSYIKDINMEDVSVVEDMDFSTYLTNLDNIDSASPENASELNREAMEVIYERKSTSEDKSIYKELRDSTGLLIYKRRIIETRKDGYIKASMICALSKKSLDGWLYKPSTRHLINKLATELGVSPMSLYERVKTLQTGTWIHPLLADSLIKWCDGHKLPRDNTLKGSLYIYLDTKARVYRTGWTNNFLTKNKTLTNTIPHLELVDVRHNVTCDIEDTLQTRLSNYLLPSKVKWYKEDPEVIKIWNQLNEEW